MNLNTKYTFSKLNNKSKTKTKKLIFKKKKLIPKFKSKLQTLHSKPYTLTLNLIPQIIKPKY